MANPRMTITDLAWSLLFMVIYLPVMGVCIFGLFLFGGPDIADSPNEAIEILAAVAVGVVIGLSWLLSLFLFGLLTRRFLSEASYERWRRQFENARRGASRKPFFARCFFKMVKPKRADSAL